jgi:hypothetical protein
MRTSDSEVSAKAGGGGFVEGPLGASDITPGYAGQQPPYRPRDLA